MTEFTDKNIGFDISNELYREYFYPDDKVLRVNKPLKLFIEKKPGGDRHRIIAAYENTTGEYGMYISPGWLAIRWTTHEKTHGMEF